MTRSHLQRAVEIVYDIILMLEELLCCRINRTDNPNVSVWGIFNQCTSNCHICNTVCKHTSFMRKKAWPEKKPIS